MMQKLKINNQSGFTLFEVIVVLILMGILAVGLTLGLVKVIENYMFAQEATEVSQKAQLAMARIKKELNDATNVTYISSSRIEYTRPYSPPSCKTATGCTFSIKQDGDNIYLEGVSPSDAVFSQQILIDHVAALDPTGQVFLKFNNFGGTAWSLETPNFTINNLAQIVVSFSVIYGANETIPFTTTINPRSGAKLNIPQLN